MPFYRHPRVQDIVYVSLNCSGKVVEPSTDCNEAKIRHSRLLRAIANRHSFVTTTFGPSEGNIYTCSR